MSSPCDIIEMTTGSSCGKESALMSISSQELIAAIEQKNGFPLSANQIDAVEHGEGPLLILAGPGTGKTEVLAVRCLKLICCDEVSPGSIILTTFTEKAARNLEDRIIDSMVFLQAMYPQIKDIDITQLRVGTLHGQCNEILQEFRYTVYQNLRLLDDVETKMLIRDKVAKKAQSSQTLMLDQFHYLFGNNPRPNLWGWTKALKKLFDRVVEDVVDVHLLLRQGGAWAELAQVYQEYHDLLKDSTTTKQSWAGSFSDEMLS